MYKEALGSIEQLPKRNRYDGNPKYFTTECLGCCAYQTFSDGELCLGGVAWKRLTRAKTRRGCLLKRQREEEKGTDSKPEQVFIIYTPGFIDFYAGTIEKLKKLRFRAELVRDEGLKPGFSVNIE